MMNIKRVISGILLLLLLSISSVLAEDLQNADIAKLAAQPKFDERDYGTVTPVRDQGNTSLCWAYSAASASETSILRSGIDKSVNANSLLLSPQQIGYEDITGEPILSAIQRAKQQAMRGIGRMPAVERSMPQHCCQHGADL